MLRAGADKISINSSAARPARTHPRRRGKNSGSARCIVVSIDAKKIAPDKWGVFSHGGRKDTGLDAVEWARKAVVLGAGEIVLNSIDADGTKQGFDPRHHAAHQRIRGSARGGQWRCAGSKEAHGGSAARERQSRCRPRAGIFHFGTYTVGDVKQFLKEKNIPVRIA